MVSVNAKRIVTALVVSLLLLSAGATMASADHNDGIFGWIDDIAENDEYYGIGGDPYVYFSSDEENLDPDDVYNSTNDAFEDGMEDATAEQTFYTVGDYTFEEPPEAIRTWNRNNLRDFRTGGRSKTLYPQNKVPRSQLENGNYIKDAYVEFFSIDPSTVVHVRPSDGEGNGDVNEYRVGQTVDLHFTHNARTEGPTAGLLDRAADAIIKEKKLVDLEEYGVEYTRVYASDCPSGGECLIAERENPGQKVRFNDVQLPSTGTQTLRVEAKYAVKYEVTLKNSDWGCSGDWISVDNYKPTSDVECEWSDYEVVDINHPTDDVVVEDTIQVTVTEPDVTAVKADLPGEYESYHVQGLDRAEWSKITFGKNGQEAVGVRSAWRYFGARDQRWDMSCEKDGGAGVTDVTVGAGTCTTGGDARHVDSYARPLLTHAIPSPFGVTSDSDANAIVATPESRAYSYPNARAHKTCRSMEYQSENGRYGSFEETNNCNWVFVMYQAIDPQTDVYSEPESVVVQRQSEADYVRAYGLVEGSATDVEITDTRDVHLAKIDYQRLISGQDLPEDLRESETQDLPGEDEVRVSITLYDDETDEPIDLTERDGEYIRITDGTRTYTVVPGADGTVTLDLKETAGTYRLQYIHQDWWDTPLHQQAYITEGALHKSPNNTFTSDSTWYALSRFAVVLLMPLVLLITILRAAGMEVSVWDFYKIVKEDWLP